MSTTLTRLVLDLLLLRRYDPLWQLPRRLSALERRGLHLSEHRLFHLETRQVRLVFAWKWRFQTGGTAACSAYQCGRLDSGGIRFPRVWTILGRLYHPWLQIGRADLDCYIVFTKLEPSYKTLCLGKIDGSCHSPQTPALQWDSLHDPRQSIL